MPVNNQMQPPSGLRQFQQPQGQPGQKPGKPQKPLELGANVNAGVLLRDPKEYDTAADTAAFAGWSDVTPHVAGGAIQIIGGIRPLGGELDGGEAAAVDGEKEVDAPAAAPVAAPEEAVAQPSEAGQEGGLVAAVQQVYGNEVKGGKPGVKPKGK